MCGRSHTFAATLTAACLLAACDKAGSSAASRPAASAPAQTQPTPAVLEVVWRYSGGASFETSPAAADGTLYLGDTAGTLHALDAATGLPRWRRALGRRLTAPPVADRPTVYVGDLDGVLHAVDAASGETRWTFQCKGTFWAGVTIVEDGVLAADETGQVVRLDANGLQRWSWQGPNRINAAAVIWKGLAVFAGCDGELHGLRLADGAEQLKFSLGDPAGATPLLVGDTAIVGVAGGRVVAVDLAAGKEAWSYQGDSTEMVYGAPVRGGELVLVGIGEQVHAIGAADGRKRWVWAAEAGVEAAVVVAEGVIYVCTLDGHLYALEVSTGQLLGRFAAGGAISAAPVVRGERVTVADRSGVVYSCSTYLPAGKTGSGVVKQQGR